MEGWRDWQGLRVGEALMMCGFPLGALAFEDGAIAAVQESPLAFLRFCLALLLLSLSVYLCNSWGGRETDRVNPRLRSLPLSAGKTLTLSLVLAAVAIGLFHWGSYQGRASLWAGLSYLLWLFYSHRTTNFKGRPLLAVLVHLVGGMLLLLLGASFCASLSAGTFVVGLFFALAFLAGHFNHQLIDYDADGRASLQTTAHQYGPRFVWRAGARSFAAAYLVLAVAASWQVIPWQAASPYLVSAVLHGLLLLRQQAPIVEGSDSGGAGARQTDAGGTVDGEACRRYRRGYRILFSLATAAAFVASHCLP